MMRPRRSLLRGVFITAYIRQLPESFKNIEGEGFTLSKNDVYNKIVSPLRIAHLLEVNERSAVHGSKVKTPDPFNQEKQMA
ncbi:MAG: hypothetical protein QF879_16190, partial [Candidatus Latescibacteria bacterium]|nr:hypothetical protein [Candidatus Latescibacterota bacterium]